MKPPLESEIVIKSITQIMAQKTFYATTASKLGVFQEANCWLLVPCLAKAGLP
jgi:hypothetical protein